MKKTFCDKCGKELTDGTMMYKIKQSFYIPSPNSFKGHLCRECAREVREFIRDKEYSKMELNTDILNDLIDNYTDMNCGSEGSCEYCILVSGGETKCIYANYDGQEFTHSKSAKCEREIRKHLFNEKELQEDSKEDSKEDFVILSLIYAKNNGRIIDRKKFPTQEEAEKFYRAVLRLNSELIGCSIFDSGELLLKTMEGEQTMIERS